jgi:hypothetical protein
MRKLTVVLVVCGLAASATAQEWKTTVDLSWVCKYMWRGVDMYDNAGAYQPSVDFRHESGLGANIWMSMPDRGGDAYGETGRWDMAQLNYTLYYANTIGEACYETNYKVGYRYYDFFKHHSKLMDDHEAFIEIEMPKITGNAIIPHAAFYSMWPTSHDHTDANYALFYQVGFSYLLPTEEQLPNLPLTFSWDIQYIDGSKIEVDQDLSHMVWGLKTEFDGPVGGKFVPAVYFQNTFDKSVNNEDEFWGGLSYVLAF